LRKYRRNGLITFTLNLKKTEEEEDRHVKVTNLATGEVLEGNLAPLESELDTWLELHPGWEPNPREMDDDDDDDDDNDDENSKDAKEENKNGEKNESGEATVSQ
jgi:SWI/SNF-related matrix-associated actin-dependent regulator of chromatin subfamily A protein 2/4